MPGTTSLRSALPSAGQALTTLRAFFHLAPGPNRWYHALAASLAVGTPVMLGVVSGHQAEGVLAATGAWASLYGWGMPYRRKAWTIAAAGFFLVLGIGLGIATIGNPLLSLVTIGVFGAVITLVANAWSFGPPGAYMLMLSAAVGTSLWTRQDSPGLAMCLVAAGAALSWVLQMVPGLLDPTGPERRSVAHAEAEVAQLDTDATAPALARAYAAVDAAWNNLRSAGRGTVVSGHEGASTPRHEIRPARLASLDERALALADTVTAASARVNGQADQAQPIRSGRIPTGPSLMALLMDAVTRPHSLGRIAAFRVLIACLVAGALGSLVPFGQPYWAMAAATLILSTGAALKVSLLKGLNRAVGTGLGIIVAFAILSWDPQGLALVGVLMALQFTIEMLVVRNYAVAATFITPLALTMASINIDQGPGEIVAGRGIDTAIGLVIGIVALLVIAPLASRRRVESMQLETLDAITTPLVLLRIGADMNSSAAQRFRQRLSRQVTGLVASQQHALEDSRPVAEHARESEADVTDVSALAYDVLGATRRAPVSRAEVGVLDDRLDQLSKRVLAEQERRDTEPVAALDDIADDDWIGPDRG